MKLNEHPRRRWLSLGAAITFLVGLASASYFSASHVLFPAAPIIFGVLIPWCCAGTGGLLSGLARNWFLFVLNLLPLVIFPLSIAVGIVTEPLFGRGANVGLSG